MTTEQQTAVTRPIIGIQNRTAQEVFDIMCDRFRLASQADQGWIVSNGAGDKWRTWDVLGPVWTGHRDQATRYARRIDAENVHREDDDAWRIEPYAATHPQPSQKGEGDE